MGLNDPREASQKTEREGDPIDRSSSRDLGLGPDLNGEPRMKIVKDLPGEVGIAIRSIEI